MYLIDLITEKHLEFLGDVEWEYRGIRERLVIKNGEYWWEDFLKDDRGWYPVCGCDGHIASCILEHDIRVKLAKLNIYVTRLGGCYYANKEIDGGMIDEPLSTSKVFEELQDVVEIWVFCNVEELLIAAMDAVIAEEKLK